VLLSTFEEDLIPATNYDDYYSKDDAGPMPIRTVKMASIGLGHARLKGALRHPSSFKQCTWMD
jgi:hypothetical protein